MSFNKSDFIFSKGQPKDNSDPGFTLKGHVLRWVSGGVEARRAPRFWQPLKLSHIPKELHQEFQTKMRSMIDGDTIRRRDLVLAFAKEDLVKERRKDIFEQQKANEAVFRGNALIAGNDHVRTMKDTSLTTERVSADQFS